MNQQKPWLDVAIVATAVDSDADRQRHESLRMRDRKGEAYIRNLQCANCVRELSQVSGFRFQAWSRCQLSGIRFQAWSEWSHHGSRSTAATAPPNGNSIEPVRVTRSEREYDHPNRADESSVGSR